MNLIRRRLARRASAALVAAGLLLCGGTTASAQIGASGPILDGDLSGTGAAEAITLIEFLLGELGPYGAGSNQPQGDATPYPGPCPDAGSIVEDGNHSVSYSLEVHADADAGASLLALDVSYCIIVSTDPCTIQCFTLSLRWFNLTFDKLYSVFIAPPPPPAPQPPPPLPPSGGTSPTNYSYQLVDRGGGCIEIEILVTPWGAVLTGEEFAEQYPGLKQLVIEILAARLAPYGIPVDPDCVTWGRP